MNFGTRFVTREVAASTFWAASARPHILRDLDTLAETLQFGPRRRICAEANGSEYWHRIASGAARRLAPPAHGGRRIVDLLGPGEFFGFHVPDDCGFVVEAAGEGATVVRYPRWCVEFLAEVEPVTATALRELTRKAVSRMRLRLLFTPRMTAIAKVGSFLLDAAERSPRGSLAWFDLPAPLPDIAEYLAISVEILEREMAALAERRTIVRAAPRRIRILDRMVLEEIGGEATAAEAAHAE